MWRKNRRVNKGSRCVGVDPNRNWPIDWQGSSDDPCDETFRGASAGSEPEVQGLMNVVKSVASKQGVKLFIDYHSYQQVMSVRMCYSVFVFVCLVSSLFLLVLVSSLFLLVLRLFFTRSPLR